METIGYLKEIYGYDTPIFLKDIRIGGKSKAAIKQDLYRAAKTGDIMRKASGVYCFPSEGNEIAGVIFDDIVEKKYISGKHLGSMGLSELDVYGYYTGMTFLNRIHLSEQVPLVLEITTNNTSSKKRTFAIGKRRVILRKPKVEIDYKNAKILQFLDMFRWLASYEIEEYRKKIIAYAKEQKISYSSMVPYLKYYGADTIDKIEIARLKKYL